MQEFGRVAGRGSRRIVMSRAVEMHRDLLGVLKQLVKVPTRCKHWLQNHAQREQAQQDRPKSWLATESPNHREILAVEGRLYNSIARSWEGVAVREPRHALRNGDAAVV